MWGGKKEGSDCDYNNVHEYDWLLSGCYVDTAGVRTERGRLDTEGSVRVRARVWMWDQSKQVWTF